MNWYLTVLKKYAVFDGRAGRQEFWFFFLFNLIVVIVLGFIDKMLGSAGFLGLIYALAVLLPNIGVSIRRLHDTNRSGWWLLLSFIPLIGAIVLLVFMALEGTPGANQYGEGPEGEMA